MTSRVAPASELHPPAGIVTRMLAAILDFVVVLVLTGCVFVAVAAGLLLVNPASFSWPRTLPVNASASGLAIAVVYLTVGWAVSGQTVGGAVLGLRVVARDGCTLGWWRAGLRAIFCVFVPLGLFWSAVSVSRRSVQDLLVGSTVVYDGR